MHLNLSLLISCHIIWVILQTARFCSTVISILLSSQLINAVVLLILLSALNDPVQYRYHLTSSELGTDIDVMDDASKLQLILPLLKDKCPQRSIQTVESQPMPCFSSSSLRIYCCEVIGFVFGAVDYIKQDNFLIFYPQGNWLINLLVDI